MISLLAIWLTSRPSTKQVSFGWHFAKVLGAMISILIIWVLTSGLANEALRSRMKYDFEIDGSIMLIRSSIGFCLDVIMGCLLHQHGHFIKQMDLPIQTLEKLKMTYSNQFLIARKMLQ